MNTFQYILVVDKIKFKFITPTFYNGFVISKLDYKYLTLTYGEVVMNKLIKFLSILQKY